MNNAIKLSKYIHQNDKQYWHKIKQTKIYYIISSSKHPSTLFPAIYYYLYPVSVICRNSYINKRISVLVNLYEFKYNMTTDAQNFSDTSWCLFKKMAHKKHNKIIPLSHKSHFAWHQLIPVSKNTMWQARQLNEKEWILN